MTTLLITRHPGAIEWATRRGLPIHRQVHHLDPETIRPGDVVIGTLPLNLAAEVCARGAKFHSLTLDLPAHLRGQELSAEELEACGARLEEFVVSLSPDSATERRP
jgi:CRISPR-associated protein Csx16